MGHAPTPQARPRYTVHLLPSNLAAKTLSSAEHILSKVCCDPTPVRRGVVAAVKRHVRKARFFLCKQRTELDPSIPTALLAGFSTMKETLFCFNVSDPTIVGLTTPPVLHRPRNPLKKLRTFSPIYY